MGVPSFYRWLCAKYPRVPIDARGDETVIIDGKTIPTDTSAPNPNPIEFDNLYLDMNGIIHPCCHPEKGEAPLTESDMFLRIFDYIDRIFAMVRPRKLLYMAIDGVAPRAKMNQQRQRRFRAVQERQEHQALDGALRQIFHDSGRGHLLPPESRPAWDSNVITPGTQFMANLSEALRYFIAARFTNDPGWKDIKVIFSDATVPGEGEHKIMHHIRNQRSQPNYNPNTVHCLYGMDADLIMLALASHEPHFYIVREVVFERSEMRCSYCNKQGHHNGECGTAAASNSNTGNPMRQKKQGDGIGGFGPNGYQTDEKSNDQFGANVDDVENEVKHDVPEVRPDRLMHYLSKKDLAHYEPIELASKIEYQKREAVPFQFLCIATLREYLDEELRFPSALYDVERAIDDWVFLCFFVGNDFLPHMPSLEIRDNAIGILTKMWKSLMLSHIQPMEQRMIQDFIQTVPNHLRQRYNPQTLTTSQIKDQIPSQQIEDWRNVLYLTNSGELGLEQLHNFIQSFAPFETAILFAKHKVESDKVRKQKRLLQQKQQQEHGDKIKVAEIQNNDLAQAQEEENKRAAQIIELGEQNQHFNQQQQQQQQDGDADNSPTHDAKRQHSLTEPTDAKSMELVQLPNDVSKTPTSDVSSEDVSPDAEEPIESKSDTMLHSLLRLASKQRGTQLSDMIIQQPVVQAPDDDEDEDDEEQTSIGETTDPSSSINTEAVVSTEKTAKRRRKRAKTTQGERLNSVNLDAIAYDKMLRALQGQLQIAPASEDTVRLGEEDYMLRYYRQKFHVDPSTDKAAYEHIHLAYITGLRWVLHYYYKGCPSWNWYYPYHYAPLIISLADITLEQYRLDTSSPLNPTKCDFPQDDLRDPHTIITTSLFSNATPILPYEQLLSVFPAGSSHALPQPLAELMLEPDSPIADFYPEQFGLDLNHRRYLWQGVVQLPFIDMPRLQRSVAKRQDRLTYEELRRNRHGMSYVFSYCANTGVEAPIKSNPFGMFDSAETNDTSITQVQIALEHQNAKLRDQCPSQNGDAMITLEDTKEQISMSSFITEWNQLKQQSNQLLSAGQIDTYQKTIPKRQTELYRHLRQLFRFRDIPTLPKTSNTSPNRSNSDNAALHQASAAMQYTHDVSQWQYNFEMLRNDPDATALLIQPIDRVIEPALASLFQTSLKCEGTTQYMSQSVATAAAGKYFLQGTVSSMCDQISPGQDIHPDYCYRVPNKTPVLRKVPVISFIFAPLPAREHVCHLLDGSNECPRVLNDRDKRVIGVQNKSFGTYTFEYLCTVIATNDVYNREGSLGADVIPFHAIGIPIQGQPQMANNNNSNNSNNPNKRNKARYNNRGNNNQNQNQNQNVQPFSQTNMPYNLPNYPQQPQQQQHQPPPPPPPQQYQPQPQFYNGYPQPMQYQPSQWPQQQQQQWVIPPPPPFATQQPGAWQPQTYQPQMSFNPMNGPQPPQQQQQQRQKNKGGRGHTFQHP